MASAYDFTFETLAGAPYPLSALRGQPMLVVNTASKCGFTPQYAGLEATWKAYRTAGLMVIGVPSNDFANQEPGDAAAISTFCETNYGVDFPMMAKVHVKGGAAHPFFAWAGNEGGILSKPRWNFFKYLINRQGGLETWFSSFTRPGSDKFIAAVKKVI